MATITFKGSPIHTAGDLPKVGDQAPDFQLTRASLEDVRLADFAGKKKIINIVPSLDTGICATSTKRFEQEVASLPDTVVLTVSRDLPFAQKRFCEGAGIKSVVALSELRNRDFGQAYGVAQIDGPMAGLLSRALVVLDAQNRVLYTQLVPEIAQEPDYGAAIAAIKSA
jgi:thiol peroxidase